uniref:DNA replication complex GINS protein SLD5 n=2 Tax=Davidia involucrata TaxID=16924 RepID=A0A5B7AIF6_DAVIN
MDSGSGDGSGFSAMDDYESLIATTDAELLKRAWRNEKAAPEILQFEASLVRRSREQIQLMEETVEEYMRSGIDPLTVSLYQMDMDRTLFLLRSYLRIRLQKIEKHMFCIQKTTELWNRLSKQEQKFAKRCIEDIQQHFEQSVLSKLPDRYKSHLKQSVISEEDDMVPGPQLDTFVICRSKSFLGAFQLDDSGEEKPVDLEADDLYALRYKSIKPLVQSEQIDLVRVYALL